MRYRCAELLRCTAIVALVVLMLGAGGMIVAAEEPVQLTGETPIETQLAGSNAGAFDYYHLAYPGGEIEVDIQVYFEIRDPMLAEGFGFNVYGPGDTEGRGEGKDYGTYLEFSYKDSEPGDLFVQVYNYTDETLGYRIVAEGLPEGAQVTVEAAPAGEPAEPEPLEEGETVSGGIVGSLAGAFAKHPLQYAGDEEDVMVVLHMWPADPSFEGAMGFKIYDLHGNDIATGEPNDTLGQRTATFASDEAGQYLVVVFNYTDGVSMGYTLEISR